MSEYPELKFPTSVDNTMMSAYASCGLRGCMEYNMWRSPHGKSIHLHAGGAFAAGCEAFRVSYYTDGPNQGDYDKALIAAHIAFTKYWGVYATDDSELKSYHRMWFAFQQYWEEFHPERDDYQPMLMPDGKPAVEFTFAIPTHVKHPDTGEPIVYAGRADAIMEKQSASGRTHRFVTDEKTTKSMGNSWAYQWDMRGQFIGYTYAARSMGMDVHGALVRGICIYKERDTAFDQKPLLYTDEHLERWWLNMNRRLQEWVYQYQEAQARVREGVEPWSAYFMSYGDACQAYGGCGYKTVCLSGQYVFSLAGMAERVWMPHLKDPNNPTDEDLAPNVYDFDLSEYM